MKNLNKKAFGGLLGLLVTMTALLFLPAWTLDYWQAWVFLAVFFGPGLAITLYLKENTFASATIELAPEQKVITTGLYSLVRHPMYMGGFFMFVGMALSLGSWWGLFVFLLIMPAHIWRIFDEEKFLTENLPGYKEYRNKVKYRLAPYIW